MLCFRTAIHCQYWILPSTYSSLNISDIFKECPSSPYICAVLYMPLCISCTLSSCHGYSRNCMGKLCSKYCPCTRPGRGRKTLAHRIVTMKLQEKLKECEILIDNDYFLAAVKPVFMEQARMAIFEVYCRIHQCIDLNMLSERLGMDRTEAEKWIATLIRNARLNARCVHFSTWPLGKASFYQQ